MIAERRGDDAPLVGQGPSPDLLAVESLAAGYHGRPVIRDVTLSLAAGEVVGLIGPNGSGKTTFIRAVTGALRPQRGTVSFRGSDATRMSQRDLARLVSVVPQDPVLPPAFTALDCVLMGRTPHLRLLQQEGGHDYAVARRAMAETATLDLAGRRLGELSGGERQRVVVARALAQETPVLLLDEPTAHLDIGHQAGVLALVRSIARGQSKAVLAVVHDLTLAGQYCDRLVLLRDGRVVATGSPLDVLQPDLLEATYGLKVSVFPHPGTGTPVVAPSGGPS